MLMNKCCHSYVNFVKETAHCIHWMQEKESIQSTAADTLLSFAFFWVHRLIGNTQELSG